MPTERLKVNEPLPFEKPGPFDFDGRSNRKSVKGREGDSLTGRVGCKGRSGFGIEVDPPTDAAIGEPRRQPQVDLA
jgi:hypothetical protein